MPRRPLQVIGHGPVVFQFQFALDQVGDHRRHAAQLRMSKGIDQPGFGDEFAVGIADALGNADRTVAVLAHGFIDTRQEFLRVEIPDRRGQTAAQRDARILVAEDNIVNQKVAIGILASLGYRADVVANGLEAVEAVGRIPYAAILMDCQMPEMDGYEATRAIRLREGTGRHTPIIALTADVMKDARAKSLSAGMDDHITKPLKPAELAAVLDRSLLKLAVVESPPLAAEPQSDDGVDRAVLDGLRSLENAGTPGLVETLVDCFLEETPRQLADLRHAVQCGDAKQLGTLAHKLKGSVANLGAHGMVRTCTELEALGQGGDTGIASQLVAELEQQFNLASTVLRSEVAKV